MKCILLLLTAFFLVTFTLIAVCVSSNYEYHHERLYSR